MTAHTTRRDIGTNVLGGVITYLLILLFTKIPQILPQDEGVYLDIRQEVAVFDSLTITKYTMKNSSDHIFKPVRAVLRSTGRVIAGLVESPRQHAYVPTLGDSLRWSGDVRPDETTTITVIAIGRSIPATASESVEATYAQLDSTGSAVARRARVRTAAEAREARLSAVLRNLAIAAAIGIVMLLVLGVRKFRSRRNNRLRAGTGGNSKPASIQQPDH